MLSYRLCYINQKCEPHVTKVIPVGLDNITKNRSWECLNCPIISSCFQKLCRSLSLREPELFNHWAVNLNVLTGLTLYVCGKTLISVRLWMCVLGESSWVSDTTLAGDCISNYFSHVYLLLLLLKYQGRRQTTLWPYGRLSPPTGDPPHPSSSFVVIVGSSSIAIQLNRCHVIFFSQQLLIFRGKHKFTFSTLA